jgi:hypothetical protein
MARHTAKPAHTVSAVCHVIAVTRGKLEVCRVPDILPTTKNAIHDIFTDSGSTASPTILDEEERRTLALNFSVATTGYHQPVVMPPRHRPQCHLKVGSHKEKIKKS